MTIKKINPVSFNNLNINLINKMRPWINYKINNTLNKKIDTAIQKKTLLTIN